MNRVIAVCLLAGLGLLGCDEKPAGPTTSAPAATPAPAPVAPAADAKGPGLAPEQPSTSLGKVPTAEDLEDEAERTVVVDNLEAELDRLEAEISAGP